MMSLLLSSKVNRLNGLFISAKPICIMLFGDIRVDHGDLWSTSLFIIAGSWRNRMSCKINCSTSNLYRFKFDLSKLTYLSKLVIDVLRVIVTF